MFESIFAKLKVKLDNIEKVSLRGEFKTNIYSRYAMPSMRLYFSVHQLHQGHVVMKSKQLSLNRDKSVLVVMGKKEQKEQVAQELLMNPLMCGSFEMKVVESEKWLGDLISSGGLGASVLATVEAREGKVKGACLEVAAIVEDWRAQVVGGFENGLMLCTAVYSYRFLSNDYATSFKVKIQFNHFRS